VDLTKAEWKIQSDTELVLKLSTHPIPDQECWPEDMEKPLRITKFDPRMVQKALDYISAVGRKDRHQPQFGIVEFAGGLARGGRPEAVAIFEAPALKDLHLRVAAEDSRLREIQASLQYRLRGQHLYG
jgi:hypothetical protein